MKPKKLKRFVAQLEKSEQHLARSFREVADRHAQSPEIRDMAPELAAWSERHVVVLKSFRKKYGSSAAPEADALRKILFAGSRAGGFGLLRDLQDLALLAHQVHETWTLVGQVAQAIQDTELYRAYQDLAADTQRQLSWIKTHINVLAPQAVMVEPAAPATRSVLRRVALGTGVTAGVVGLGALGLAAGGRLLR